jgi:hypothetical protein
MRSPTRMPNTPPPGAIADDSAIVAKFDQTVAQADLEGQRGQAQRFAASGRTPPYGTPPPATPQAIPTGPPTTTFGDPYSEGGPMTPAAPITRGESARKLDTRDFPVKGIPFMTRSLVEQ